MRVTFREREKERERKREKEREKEREKREKEREKIIIIYIYSFLTFNVRYVVLFNNYVFTKCSFLPLIVIHFLISYLHIKFYVS